MRSIMKQEPTKRIVPESHTIHGYRIILGITGSIAAYKTAELARLLIKNNIEVQVVMTEAACHFITPTTMQGLSGKPVFTDQWDASVPNSMAHINLSRTADAIVIATRNSARFLGKLDDLGTIEVGKLADFVLLTADPTADINNAKLIDVVVKNGKVVDRKRLDLPINR